MSARRIHSLSVLTAIATFLLLCAGALVTGTGSGLAVPDWPLSYGQFFPPMVGGVLFEHGHRMIAGTVLILMVTQCVLIWIKGYSKGIRLLALSGVVAVLCQAFLGGLTVLLRLPIAVSVSHACLAQLFFTTALLLSSLTHPKFDLGRKLSRFSGGWDSLKIHAFLLSILFFNQLVLGAIMRHSGAGLAIPDFPAVFGGVWPRVFSPAISIHFAHRMVAYLLSVVAGTFALRLYPRVQENLNMLLWLGILLASVVFQIMLGAFIIWSRRFIPITTLHLAVGAFCLATSVLLNVKIWLEPVLSLNALSPKGGPHAVQWQPV